MADDVVVDDDNDGPGTCPKVGGVVLPRTEGSQEDLEVGFMVRRPLF